jgi:hypothetical protein
MPIPPPPPPPPTITVTCPQGTVLINGQCFFVDPGCKGPNCGQVNTGCPGGVARKSDGSCCNARDYQTGACGGKPTTQQCTGGKEYVGEGACACPKNTTEDKKGKCVEKSESRAKKKTRRPPSDSDKPTPSGPSSPNFNIQIGPGFPSGGGRPGGGKPGGGMPKGGSNCLKSYCG